MLLVVYKCEVWGVGDSEPNILMRDVSLGTTQSGGRDGPVKSP